MKKLIAAPAIAAALTFVTWTSAGAEHTASQVQTTPPEAPAAAGDDGGEDDDGGNAGLWGLLGLAGLAGLAGLRRRDRVERRYTDVGSPPGTSRP